MRNSNRGGIDPQYNSAREEYDEWVNDALNPPLLLEWFNNVFYSNSKQNDYEKLKDSLGAEYGKYIRNLEDSEKRYNEKVFPFLHSYSISVLKRREESRLADS